MNTITAQGRTTATMATAANTPNTPNAPNAANTANTAAVDPAAVAAPHPLKQEIGRAHV